MKRKLITAIIILVIFQLTNCVTVYRFVRDKRDRCYKEGVDLYSQNKFEEACDRFETVVDIEPDYKDA
jgi:outer membrane protein assembly factor BamD (BamD/ComL family)